MKVQAPSDEEIEALPEGVVLISLLSPLTQPELIGKLGGARVTAFALELIPADHAGAEHGRALFAGHSSWI